MNELTKDSYDIELLPIDFKKSEKEGYWNNSCPIGQALLRKFKIPIGTFGIGVTTISQNVKTIFNITRRGFTLNDYNEIEQYYSKNPNPKFIYYITITKA
jgi:hypothetical protein